MAYKTMNLSIDIHKAIRKHTAETGESLTAFVKRSVLAMINQESECNNISQVDKKAIEYEVYRKEDLLRVYRYLDLKYAHLLMDDSDYFEWVKSMIRYLIYQKKLAEFDKILKEGRV